VAHVREALAIAKDPLIFAGSVFQCAIAVLQGASIVMSFTVGSG
jgi:hypothetical protein